MYENSVIRAPQHQAGHELKIVSPIATKLTIPRMLHSDRSQKILPVAAPSKACRALAEWLVAHLSL
jgi:hypothetical protein